MHILLTGGTGFIGSALVPRLLACGHELVVLTRQSLDNSDSLRYVNALDEVDPESIDAVINLAGASLAERRWTAAYKRELRSSRLETTRELREWMETAQTPPSSLLSASAVGYYGPQGDEFLAEEARPRESFSSALCRDWEREALRAQVPGLRIALLRFGVVLDAGGGAFTEMARPFRFGMGNWMGRGDQWLSWVHRRDVVEAIVFLLERPTLSGPFNVTAPEPVTSRDFCGHMARHYKTLLRLPVPAPVARLLLGEMADELLLSGQRVVPTALQEAGFEFVYPGLDQALGAIREDGG